MDLLEICKRHIPFVKDENISHTKLLNKWEILIVYKDGTRDIYDASNNSMRAPIKYSERRTDDEMMLEFRIRLRGTMRREFVSQEELAEKTGISRVTINKYMNGKAIPSFINLWRIAEALGCKPNDFYWED